MHAPLPLFDPAALRMLEARGTAHCDGDAFALMARAGQAAWRCVLQHWPQARRIAVACGPGNNGGDGYVLARLARDAGACAASRSTRTSRPASSACRAST
jgi:NAD(P)H-hydrate epimerase